MIAGFAPVFVMTPRRVARPHSPRSVRAFKALSLPPGNWGSLMMADEEDKQLRIAALRNADEILLLRNRAEQELRDAKDAVERKNQELVQQREWYRVTLSSIGDAVITTDAQGAVTFMNPIAEGMTGWTLAEAAGVHPRKGIFASSMKRTREPVEHPIAAVLREGRVVGLVHDTSLIGRDGVVTPIEDSAAPIRDVSGALTGVVMVFRDVTARSATPKPR